MYEYKNKHKLNNLVQGLNKSPKKMKINLKKKLFHMPPSSKKKEKKAMTKKREENPKKN